MARIPHKESDNDTFEIKSTFKSSLVLLNRKLPLAARLYLWNRTANVRAPGLAFLMFLYDYENKKNRIKCRLTQKQDVKHSDPRLDTRFKLKRARLQEIQSNTTKARAKTKSLR